LSTKVLEKDIIQFEKEKDIILPDDFRNFMMNIGFGAGPFVFGIYSPLEMLPSISCLISSLKRLVKKYFQQTVQLSTKKVIHCQ
jgi:hypothetical protein